MRRVTDVNVRNLSAREGLKKTVEWYKENREEILKNA